MPSARADGSIVAAPTLMKHELAIATWPVSRRAARYRGSECTSASPSPAGRKRAESDYGTSTTSALCSGSECHTSSPTAAHHVEVEGAWGNRPPHFLLISDGEQNGFAYKTEGGDGLIEPLRVTGAGTELTPRRVARDNQLVERGLAMFLRAG